MDAEPIEPSRLMSLSRPRCQFSLKTLLVAVGILGTICGAGRLMHRRSFFLEKVYEHSYMKRLYGEDRGWHCPRDEWYEGDPVRGILKKEWTQMMDDSRDWEEAMERKYAYAAHHPWIFVEPDTPRPDPADYLRDD
jgi:hypothetical protein